MSDQQTRVGILVEAEARVDAAESKVRELYAVAANGPKALSAEIAKNTQLLSMYGRTVDVTNAGAVQAWRESAAAERENLEALKANELQMTKLQLVTDQFERRVAAAGAASTGAVPGIRAGASAAAYMAMSLDGADMSARGVIRSVSSMSLLMGNAIPGMADYAAGISVIGVELGLLYEMWKKANDEGGKASALFETQLRLMHATDGRGDAEHVNGAAFDRLREQIEMKRKAAEAEIDAVQNAPIWSDDNALSAHGRERLVKAHEQINQANEEQRQLEAKRDETQRRVSEERTRTAEERQSAAAERARRLTQQEAEKADALEQKIADDAMRAHDRQHRSQLEKDLDAINREFVAREREIDRLTTLSAARRAQLHAENNTDHDSQTSGALDADSERRAEAARKANEKLAEMVARDNDRVTQALASTDTVATKIAAAQRALDEELRKIDDEKDASDAARREARLAAERAFEAEKVKIRRDASEKSDADYRRALDRIERATQHSVDMIVRAHRISAPAIAAAMLAPLVTYMEAQAVKDSIAGGAHILTGDFLQAAGYLAAAALWTTGAMEVASIGGTSTSGRGGGAAGGSGGGVFQPRDDGASGGVTVNLYTKDPYGRDAIADTIYHVGQAQLYNQPIYVPPTTGLRRAA